MATKEINIAFAPGEKVYYHQYGKISFCCIDYVQIKKPNKGETTYPVTYYLDRGDSMDIPPLTLPPAQLYKSLQAAIQATAQQSTLFV